ncbi:hypothetical protein E2C06_29725 [Dankookia rubra]|uniref:Uncharacterized protein n=2 Tax=Dankookia rubra TaxID=1442381 RepID=A0A4R5Q7U1_9PROT|nr:hypothetical protein E2C06_29725 [Dankookia rubra]
MASPVDAIAEALRAPGLQAKFEALEARRAALEAEAAVASPTASAVHPNSAGVYRAGLADLRGALSSGTAPDALEAARVPIDKVAVHPSDHGGRSPGIELVGDLLAKPGAGGADCCKDPLGTSVLSAFTSPVTAGQGGNTFP